MNKVFNFKNINAYLWKTYKALKIELNLVHTNGFLTEELFNDLEKILIWTSQHIEINSILVCSNTDHFGLGIDPNEINNLSQEKFKELLEKIQKIIYSFLFMPQTIIVNIKKGAKEISSELSIIGDIRLGYKNIELSFNHLTKGLSPCCGGISLLTNFISKNYVGKWVLSSLPVKKNELLRSGYLAEIIPDNPDTEVNYIEKYLSQIVKQAPVQRIQAKRAILETYLENFKMKTLLDQKIILPGILSTGDWQEFISSKNEKRSPRYTPSKKMADILKELKRKNSNTSTSIH